MQVVLVSVAAITNYHELGGLKITKCILSEFKRLEVGGQDTQLMSFGDSERESVHVSLPACGGCWQPLALLDLQLHPSVPLHVHIAVVRVCPPLLIGTPFLELGLSLTFSLEPTSQSLLYLQQSKVNGLLSGFISLL